MNKKLKQGVLLGILMNFIVNFVYQSIRFYRTGTFDPSFLLGWLTGTLLIFLALFLYQRFRKKRGEGDLPFDDERTRHLFMKFHAIAFFVLLISLSILLVMMSVMNISSISLKTFSFAVMALWLIMASGSLVIFLRT